jgi:undecaprenyl-diphosphatase
MSSPLLQALILGVVQGLTEFLPVSSSGHLALAQSLIPGFEQPGVFLDVMLHVGTLAAVAVYFRRELGQLARALPGLWPGAAGKDKESRRLLLGIVAASIPTAVIGILLEDRVEAFMSSVPIVGAALMVTGLWLLAGEALGRKAEARPGSPGLGRSLLIGLAQGIAVTPGISRSGSTIATARALGATGPEAARFSFLLSLPAVGGAALLTALKNREAILASTGEQIAAYAVGPLVAGLVGFVAIGLVMRLLRSGRFVWFAAYCLVLGALSLGLGLYFGR